MSGRIVEYKVVEGFGTSTAAKSDLAQAVNKAIAEGWEPMGGVGGGTDPSLFTSLFQALVKREGGPNSN